MKKHAKRAIVKTINALGYGIERLQPHVTEPHYLQQDERYAKIIEAVEPYTMTPYEKIAAMVDAVRYISRAGIPGAIVECGVWRGGSMMAAALALQEANDLRELYLFDTYAGMTAPTGVDIDWQGIAAADRYESSAAPDHNEWCYASLEDVRRNVASTGYPQHLCHFVKGDVLETIPHAELHQISILRLDTDWYESTLHELTHLYPRLSTGGALIIDDYGYWRGCQQAVDQYFAERGPFLCRIDSTGLLGIKPDSGD